MTYAANTSVPVDRSRTEIERTLVRYGADAFAYGWADDNAIIQFRAHGKQVKFVLPLPSWDDALKRSAGRRGGRTAIQARHEQEIRSRWRALALVIKAKLEAVESGIVVFDEEFLAHIVLPDGRTAGEWLRPQLEESYASGAMPQEMRLALPRGRS